jgi:hypothetical protein
LVQTSLKEIKNKYIMNIKKNVAVSDSGMIFNPDTGETYTVNPIGAEIINGIKEGNTSTEISNKVTSKYTVEPSTFEKDFDDFISLLRNYSLIEDAE